MQQINNPFDAPEPVDPNAPTVTRVRSGATNASGDYFAQRVASASAKVSQLKEAQQRYVEKQKQEAKYDVSTAGLQRRDSTLIRAANHGRQLWSNVSASFEDAEDRGRISAKADQANTLRMRIPGSTIEAYNRYLIGEQTPEDVKLLNSGYSATGFAKPGLLSRDKYEGKSNFQILKEADAYEAEATKMAGDPLKGKKQDQDAFERVNPYYQDKRAKALKKARDYIQVDEFRDAANSLDANGSPIRASVARGIANTAQFLGDTYESTKHPFALAENLGTVAPALVLGPASMGLDALTQAKTDRVRSQAQYRERNDGQLPSTSESFAMDAMAGANFGLNYLENATLGALVKGNRIGKSRENNPDAGIIRTTAGATGGLLADVAKAVGVNGLATGLQAKIQTGAGALEFTNEHDETIIEQAALGGVLAGAMTTPSSVLHAGKRIVGKAMETSEVRANIQASRATQAENVDPTSPNFNPAEAINKLVERYDTTEGVDNSKVVEEAQGALKVAQSRFAEVDKVRQGMKKDMGLIEELRNQIDVDRSSMADDPANAVMYQKGIDMSMDHIKALEAKYDAKVVKAIETEHAQATKLKDKATAAFQGFTTLRDGVEGTKVSATVAKDVESVLQSADATPEAVAEATKHVRSFPMMYEPTKLKQFADDLTNDLTDPQRAVLREFSELRTQEHLSKGIDTVSDNLVNGGKNYRKLSDYFSGYAEAQRTGDVGTQEILTTQFERLDASFAKKADLARKLLDRTTKGQWYQVIKTENSGWKINRGKYLTQEALRKNGGFDIKSGSHSLVEAIERDAQAVAQSHQVFQQMQTPEYVGEVVEPTVQPEPTVPGEPTPDAVVEPTVTPTPEAEPTVPQADAAKEPVVPKPKPKAKTSKATKPKAESKQQSLDLGDPISEATKAEPTQKADPVTTEPKPEQKPQKDNKQLDPVDRAEDVQKTSDEKVEGEAQSEPTNRVDEDGLATTEEQAKAATPEDSAPSKEAEDILPVFRDVTNAERAKEAKKPYLAQNLLRRFFRQGSKDQKALALTRTPDFVNKVLKGENVSEFLKGQLGKEASEQQRRHMDDFVAFNDRFSKAIDEVFKPKEGKNMEFMHQDMVHYLTNEQGQLTANVRSAIALAAFNWILENGSEHQFELDDASIAKMLGLDSSAGYRIPNSVRQVMGVMGHAQNPVISSIGGRAIRSLQIKATKKADANMQGRLEASTGALAVHVLHQMNMIQMDSVTVNEQLKMVKEITKDPLAADPVFTLQGKETTPKGTFHVLGTTGNVRFKPAPGFKGVVDVWLNKTVGDKVTKHKVTFKADGKSNASQTQVIEQVKDGHRQIPFIRVAHAHDKGRLVEAREDIAEILANAKGTRGFLNTVLGSDDPKVRPVFEKPKALEQKSIRKSKLSIPSLMRDNSSKAMQNSFTARKPIVNLMRVLSVESEGMLKTMLNINDSEEHLNTFHKSVRDGKRASFRNDWNSLQNALEFMDDVNAQEKGMDTEFYMPMTVWSNQRVGYAPNMFNVQTSQIHRAMAGMSAHRTEVDTSLGIFDKNDKTTVYGTFLRALALATENASDFIQFPPDYKAGKTADKASSKEFLPLYEAYIQSPKVQDAIDAMGRVLKATELGKAPELKDVEMVGAQVADFGMGAQSLLALTEMAQFKEAKEAGKPFIASIGIESDGVTNGPAIANTLAGTLTYALAMQFGLVPKAEGGATQYIKNYFDIKSEGKADYYQTFGGLQKDYMQLIFGAPEVGPNTGRGIMAGALARLAGGFGDRGSAKKWATPFNYAAGYPALKAALARGMVENIDTRFAEIAQMAKKDYALAEIEYTQLVNDINIAINYHNKQMQVRGEVTAETALKTLPIIEAELRMMDPTIEFMPRPTSLDDKDAFAPYVKSLGFDISEVKSVAEFVGHLNDTIHNTNKGLVRAKKVAKLIPTNVARDLTGLADFSLNAEQYAALSLVSVATHGLASEFAIKEAAKDYIATRDLNITLNNVAFESYNALRNAMIEKVVAEKEKAGLIPKRQVTKDGKAIDMALERISSEELAKIDADLMAYSPIVVTASGAESSNPVESGLFMAKQDRGYDNEGANEVSSRHSYDGIEKVITTGVLKANEIGPGVGGSAAHVQSSDSYISNSTVGYTPSINVHDADIGGLNNYADMALHQNKKFFDLMVNYRMQVETLNALVRPLNGMAVAIDRFGLQGRVDTEAFVKMFDKQITQAMSKAGIPFGGLDRSDMLVAISNAKYDAEIQKIQFAQSLYAVHQYGGEGGEFVLGKAEHDRLDAELTDLIHAREESAKEVKDLGDRVFKKLGESPREEDGPSDFTKMHKELLTFKGKEIPREKMLDILDAQIKDSGDAVHSELYKVLKGIIPEDLKFKYEDRAWVGTKQASGWYNPTSNTVSIRVTDSQFSHVRPELFLHELVHASLVSITTSSHQHPEVKEAITRLDTLRNQVEQATGNKFPEATKNVEEFMAWGLTNPMFQDALRGITVAKGDRNRKGLGSAFTRFVKGITDILFNGLKKPSGKNISAIEALLLDSAEIIQYVQQKNPARSYVPPRVFNMVKSADEIIQDAKTRSARELFDTFSSGNTSPEFLNHLAHVTDTSISKLFETLGQDHLDDLTQPTDYTPHAMERIHQLSEREAYVAEVIATLVHNVQDRAEGSPTVRELRRMYDTARERLSVEDFHNGDWTTATAVERHHAKRQYDNIFNAASTDGRSNYLANFVGLAIGSERFNNLLKMGVPKRKETKRHALDVVTPIMNAYHNIVNMFMGLMARSSQGTMDVRLQKMTDTLVKIQTHKRAKLLEKFDFGWEYAHDKSVELTSKLASGAVSQVMTRTGKVKGVLPVRLTKQLAKLAVRDGVHEIPRVMKEMRDTYNPNTRYGELMQIGAEIKSNEEYKNVFEQHLRNTVSVQTARKNWIDQIKLLSNSIFDKGGKDMTRDEQTAVTYMVMRTDMHTLLNGRNFKEVLNLVTEPVARKREITRIENELARMDVDGNDMANRAHELGYYMATGEPGSGQAFNARMIADGVATHYRKTTKADPAVIKAIDDLATLHALGYAHKRHAKGFDAVLARENARTDGVHGIESLMKLHSFAAKEAELDFKDNPYGMHKGYTPEITHSHRETLTAPLRDKEKLEREGWELQTELERDPADGRKFPTGLFMLKDGGKQRIFSGAVTFDATQASGTTVSDGANGVVTAEYTKELMARSKIRSTIPAKNYNPEMHTGPRMANRYDAEGNIVDFTYSMSAHARDTLLARNNSFSDLMGAYYGNNFGRAPVAEQNRKVITAMYDDYLEAYKREPRAFVTISPNSSDPRLAEIWRMLPYDVKQEAAALWGKGNPMVVRNDLVNLGFGFKKYSVGEMFDKAAGERNVLEKGMVLVFEAIAGLTFKPKERAQLMAVRGERFIQEAMKLIKDIIVIRTATVLWGNLKANAILLMAYGVNPLHLFRDTSIALRSGLQYRKDRALMIQAEANMQAGIGDYNKWQAQLVKAQDAMARNPLAEFIESGMMPNIVEDIELTSTDYTYKSRAGEALEKPLSYVPKFAKTAVAYAFVSPNTPVYKFLANATQMSDFTSKYVLYKHLTNKTRNPSTKVEALQAASDAFINYDVPTSRGLQYMNDMGLFMFTKFFLRFQKVMLKLMRTQPATVLSQHYAMEWMTNTPGVLDPLWLNHIGFPVRTSILQAPGAVADIASFKVAF